jgi:hypothetical protein
LTSDLKRVPKRAIQNARERVKAELLARKMEKAATTAAGRSK